MANTKEEKFLIKLYQIAQESNSSNFNALETGASIGQAPKLVKHTVRMLAQCNFIKKINEDDISITENGKELVLKLSPSLMAKA